MATIDDLTTATTDLLTAVNVAKSTLDTAVADAAASEDVVTAIATALTSVDGHASMTLTATQVTNAVIDNVGQTAAADLQLPAAAAGMNFILAAGAATAFAWRIKAAAADKIYLQGIAGADNGYVGMPTPTVGGYLSVFSFKTGAAEWDWMAVVGMGNWTVS